MASPLGIIVDANPNRNQVDVYALVLNNVVVNMIMASFEDIQGVARFYDYAVDVTMNGNSAAGIGHTYDAAHDTFVQPPAPPIDWVENVRSDFSGIIASIQQAVIDSGSQGGDLSNQDITAAYNSALNDNPNLDVNFRTILVSILNFVLADGV